MSIGETESICPVCLQRLPAQKIVAEDGIYLTKECPEHGSFRVLLWRGDEQSYRQWDREKQNPAKHQCQTEVSKGCPYDCGLCPEHQQQICCVLLEVTQRCNLHCPVCFASAGETGEDLSMEAIDQWYDTLMAAGGPFNIQLSGGEPTVRDDLADIIRLGREKGFSYFQLNTNGLRLAEDLAYLQSLVQAGLSNVFLQFDGLTEEPYLALRGKALLTIKQQAIANCRNAGVGVTLVPTIAPGVNLNQVGAILQFAMENMPHIRAVHFQPVSYFGRNHLPHNDQRITIPDMLQAMEQQTGGKIKEADFQGGGAENSYCSFHGNYMQQTDSSWKAVKSTGCCCISAQQSRDFVARRWSAAPVLQQNCCCNTGIQEQQQEKSGFDVFLERMENYTLAISGMLFQDAWNFDLQRVKACYLCEISPQNKIIPFCVYNLTNSSGEGLYRGKS